MLVTCSGARNTSVFLMLQKIFFYLPIDALTRLLTAMLTPKGVFVFNILAMGLCSAGDLFESALRELLSGLSGVTNIADDILVYGSAQEEHDANVIHFLCNLLSIFGIFGYITRTRWGCLGHSFISMNLFIIFSSYNIQMIYFTLGSCLQCQMECGEREFQSFHYGFSPLLVPDEHC